MDGHNRTLFHQIFCTRHPRWCYLVQPFLCLQCQCQRFPQVYFSPSNVDWWTGRHFLPSLFQAVNEFCEAKEQTGHGDFKDCTDSFIFEWVSLWEGRCPRSYRIITAENCAVSLQQMSWGLGAQVSCRAAFASSSSLKDNVKLSFFKKKFS